MRLKNTSVLFALSALMAYCSASFAVTPTPCPTMSRAQAAAAATAAAKCPTYSQTVFRGDVTKSPFVYNNPNATCDLGLSMPGLPSFGVNTGNLSSCDIAKMVTSKTIGPALQAIGSLLPGNVTVNADPRQVINGGINGALGGTTGNISGATAPISGSINGTLQNITNIFGK